MEKKLIFVKLAGRWFVLLPDYPGDPMDLEMVSGADILCETLDEYKNGFINTSNNKSVFPNLNNGNDTPFLRITRVLMRKSENISISFIRINV